MDFNIGQTKLRFIQPGITDLDKSGHFSRPILRLILENLFYMRTERRHDSCLRQNQIDLDWSGARAVSIDYSEFP